MMPDGELMITMKHLRAAGMCNREPRLFCKAQGWNWTEFVTTGLPASLLLSTGDPMARKVVEAARRMAEEV